MATDESRATLKKALRASQKEVESLRSLYKARRLEALGRLAGGVAHDFNNLMTGILGISEGLANDLGPHHERQEDLRQVISAAQKATQLTKQLMALGARQVATPTRLHINAVVREMKPLFKRFLRDPIELRFSLDADSSVVFIDKNQLEQVLLDLVLNARDAILAGRPNERDSHPTSGVITLRTATVCGALENFTGDCVEISVEDRGVGMDAETLDHLFEPFYTTKEAGKGSGLGLATVYGIVKQNNGDILVSSVAGKGSLFRVLLPSAQKSAPCTENASASPARGESPAANLAMGGARLDGRPASGQETVLVVEDEEIVRKVVVQSLRRAGYHVLEASCAQAAMAVYQGLSEPLDLLLTDVVMPGMNGHQLAESLGCAHRKIAVLYMSGHTADVIMRQGLVEPGTAFIEKTFSPRALCRRVREVLDQHGTQTSPSQTHHNS
jgi:two-component system, cell cycle sensor histidine kinase and response regulator CckA